LIHAVDRLPGPAVGASEIFKHGYENYSVARRRGQITRRRVFASLGIEGPTDHWIAKLRNDSKRQLDNQTSLSYKYRVLKR
jgi:hypothetical protein